MNAFELLASDAVANGGAPIVDFKGCSLGDLLAMGLHIDAFGNVYVSEEHYKAEMLQALFDSPIR